MKQAKLVDSKVLLMEMSSGTAVGAKEYCAAVQQARSPLVFYVVWRIESIHGQRPCT